MRTYSVNDVVYRGFDRDVLTAEIVAMVIIDGAWELFALESDNNEYRSLRTTPLATLQQYVDTAYGPNTEIKIFMAGPSRKMPLKIDKEK